MFDTVASIPTYLLVVDRDLSRWKTATPHLAQQDLPRRVEILGNKGKFQVNGRGTMRLFALETKMDLSKSLLILSHLI
jgi:hypothetical protein